MPGGHHRTPAERNAEAITAVELRAKGFSIEEVAEDLGVAVSTARRRLQHGLDLSEAHDVDYLRAQAEARLDVALREVARVLEDPDLSHDLRLKAVDRIHANHTARSRLLGLDYPRAVVEQEARMEVVR